MVTTTTPSLSDTAVGQLVLRVRGTDRDGQLIRIRSPKCSVGAGSRCTLRLRAAGVGAVHCLILRGRDATIVRRWSLDTRLNGQAFTDAPLRCGDCLSVGRIELEVVNLGAAGQGDLPRPWDAASLVQPEQWEAQRRQWDEEVSQRNEQLTALQTELDARQKASEEERRQREEENAATALQWSERSREWDARQAELQAQAGDLAARQEQWEAQQRQWEQEVSQRNERLTALQAELDARQKKIDADQSQISARREEIESQSRELAAQQEQWEAQRPQWEQEVGQRDERLTTLQAELDAGKRKSTRTSRRFPPAGRKLSRKAVNWPRPGAMGSPAAAVGAGSQPAE